MIELETILGKRKRKFDLSHAERVLKLPNTSWRLPADSNFKLVGGRLTKPKKTKKADES